MAIDYRNLRYIGTPEYEAATRPPGERPVLPTFTPTEYPTYNVPERKPERVEELTQQLAAPGIRGLRSQVQRAIGRRYVNPQVARMTIREALAGYGQGLENIMGGARRGALTQYEQEYAPHVEKARLQYQTGVSKAQSEWEARRQAQMTEYQTAWQEYMKNAEKEKTVLAPSGKFIKVSSSYPNPGYA